MAVQYDFQSAFDLSGLASLTKAQLMQYVLKLGPLANIGGVIIMSGANNAHPDVTSNPRFVRYLWIDNEEPTAPILKLYIGSAGSDTYADWQNISLADGSVTVDKIAQYAVSILTYAGQSRIALNQDNTADVSKATFLVRVDNAGQYIEVVSAQSVIDAATLNPAKLSVAGAVNGMLLQYDSTVGYAKWATVSFSAAVADNSLAYSKLLNADAGQAGYIMRVNPVAPYNIQLVTNSDKVANDLLAIRSVRLNRLDDASAVSKDRIRFDGTNWVRYTPFYGPPTVGGTTVPSPNGGGQLLAPHGLGVIPRVVRCVLVCAVDDLNYTAADSDTVDALSLQGRNDAGTELAGGVTVYADATNVYANFYNGGGAAARYRLMDNTTFARSNITPGSWNVFFYADY